MDNLLWLLAGLLGAIWLTIVIGCYVIKWEVRDLRNDLGGAVQRQLPYRFGVAPIDDTRSIYDGPPVGVGAIIEQLQKQNTLIKKQCALLEKIINGIGAEAAEAEASRDRIEELIARAERRERDASNGRNDG